MEYKRLGRSDLLVSRICLGSNNFGGQVNEANSLVIIKKAIDLGINLIDTANVYTMGESEKVIGKAIQGYRDQVIIATKVGWSIGEGPNLSGLSRQHILWQVQESLKRLATNFIDIYLLHRFDPETPLEETLRTLHGLVQDGRVRYVACSNFAASQIAEAHAICESLGLENFVAVQPRYNLLQRDAEKELFPYCREAGLGVLTYSPLMGGFLTGKYTENTAPAAGSRARYNPTFWERISEQKNFLLLEKLGKIAKDANIPMRQLVLKWVLKNPAVTAAIVGASSSEQVEENCRILDSELVPAVQRKLDELA